MTKASASFAVHYVHLDGRWFSMRYVKESHAVDAAKSVVSEKPDVSAFLERNPTDSSGALRVTKIAGPECCPEHDSIDGSILTDGVCRACEDRRLARASGTRFDSDEKRLVHGASPDDPWSHAIRRPPTKGQEASA